MYPTCTKDSLDALLRPSIRIPRKCTYSNTKWASAKKVSTFIKWFEQFHQNYLIILLLGLRYEKICTKLLCTIYVQMVHRLKYNLAFDFFFSSMTNGFHLLKRNISPKRWWIDIKKVKFKNTKSTPKKEPFWNGSVASKKNSYRRFSFQYREWVFSEWVFVFQFCCACEFKVEKKWKAQKKLCKLSLALKKLREKKKLGKVQSQKLQCFFIAVMLTTWNEYYFYDGVKGLVGVLSFIFDIKFP